MDTLTKIKQAIRRTHNKLDDDLQADIDACMADLRSVGIIYADETDPLIFNAIKLWCRSLDTDDPVKAAEYMRRYDALKASLMMAEGYGHPKEVSDD
jgi:hypothetical protein